jgi:hypothetical protein
MKGFFLQDNLGYDRCVRVFIILGRDWNFTNGPCSSEYSKLIQFITNTASKPSSLLFSLKYLDFTILFSHILGLHLRYNAFQRVQPSMHLLVYFSLIASQFLVKICSIRAGFHRELQVSGPTLIKTYRKNRSNNKRMILFQCNIV